MVPNALMRPIEGCNFQLGTKVTAYLLLLNEDINNNKGNFCALADIKTQCNGLELP